MRAKSYFKLSFLLPIVLPFVALPFAEMGGGLLNALAFILWGSLIIGGIPYALFLIWLFYWMHDKDYRAIQRMTFVVPLLFVMVFFLGATFIFTPLQVLSLGESRIEGSGLVGFCFFILIVGYFYVGLTNGGFYLLRHLGYIEEYD